MKKILFSLLCVPYLLFGIHDFSFISVPKCGTNLLSKILEEMSGLRYFVAHEDTSLEDIKKNNQFSVNHTLSNSQFDFLVERNYKVISIYRDPRDQLISFIFWAKMVPSQYSDMNSSITHLIGNLFHEHWFTNFYFQFKSLIPSHNLHMVRFEDLIGSRGGGSDEEQLDTILKIADFLDIEIFEDEIHDIVNKVWGDSPTFRKGSIGDWKIYFTPEHIQLYKEKYGDLLIELGYEKDLDW